MTTETPAGATAPHQTSRAEAQRLEREPTISERLAGKAVTWGESLGGNTLPRIEGLLGSVT